MKRPWPIRRCTVPWSTPMRGAGANYSERGPLDTTTQEPRAGLQRGWCQAISVELLMSKEPYSMKQTVSSATEAREEELVEQANSEAEVRLAELDEQEDPRPDQPPLKEGVHVLGPDKP